MCAGLSVVCDKFGLTVDQDDSKEVPGLVHEDDDSDTEEGAFGQLWLDFFQPKEDQIHDGLYDPPVVAQHWPSVLMQPVPDIVSSVPEWACGYLGLSAAGCWDLALMQLGSLWFADKIHFNLCNI